MNREELERSLIKHLEDNKLCTNIFVDPFVGNIFDVQINISWGDWKHEHLRCDYLIEDFCKQNKIKFTKYNTEITEEAGSDCYSAVHQYLIST